jgi:hypothetical protein
VERVGVESDGKEGGRRKLGILKEESEKSGELLGDDGRQVRSIACCSSRIDHGHLYRIESTGRR